MARQRLVSRPPRTVTAATTTAAWTAWLVSVLFWSQHLTCEGRNLQEAGVSYSNCDLLMGVKEIEDQCNHKIQPSAIAYLPTYKRLVVVGQEYILHFQEDSAGSFQTTGCYKGDDRTIGRGDIEGAASLDFALSEPPQYDTQQHGNWKKLKALDSHILVMEETYAYQGVYLVDTSRLGSGFVKDTNATVAKFPISNYPKTLEALAFIPNLQDDDYLGVMIMGTQRRVVATCRIPLGNWEKDVDCSDDISKFDFSLDSMEYDPTFQARPGRYGALMLGSDPAGLSVYVDPWAITRGDIIEWSAPFNMRGGVVDGTKIKGIEGQAIYGNRVFYAIDDNNPQGVLVCNIDNKPSSKAQKITGWHPYDAGSLDGPSGADLMVQAEPGVPFLPPLPSVDFDLLPVSEISAAYVVARWLWYDSYGDGICGPGCKAEKDLMCLLHPEVCVHLRCLEPGADLEACAAGGFGSIDDARLLAMSHNEVIDAWEKAYEDGGWACETDFCLGTKRILRSAHRALTQQLRCEDLLLGRVASAGVTWPDCKDVPLPERIGISTPFTLAPEQLSVRWDSLNDAALKGKPRACSSECKVDKVSMCMGATVADCWEMRCRDVGAGLISSLAVDCSAPPPESAAPPALKPPRGYCTWAGHSCGGTDAGVSWCSASPGNCAHGCGLHWCYNSAKFASMKPTGTVFVTFPSEAGSEPEASPVPSSPSTVSPVAPSPLPVFSFPGGKPAASRGDGYCSSTPSCLNVPHADDTCASTISCVFGCGGTWCYGDAAPPRSAPSAGVLGAVGPAGSTTGGEADSAPVFAFGSKATGPAAIASGDDAPAQPEPTDDTVVSVPEVMQRLDLSEDKAQTLIDILLGIPNVIVSGKTQP